MAIYFNNNYFILLCLSTILNTNGARILELFTFSEESESGECNICEKLADATDGLTNLLNPDNHLPTEELVTFHCLQA